MKFLVHCYELVQVNPDNSLAECVNACAQPLFLFSDIPIAVAVVVILGSVHTTPEEFENGGFTLKMHQMFFVHSRKQIKCFPSTRRRRNLKTQQSQAAETLECTREHAHSKVLVEHHFAHHFGFSKSSVFGGQFLRISVDGRPNWRNKAPFSNSFSVVWTGP